MLATFPKTVDILKSVPKMESFSKNYRKLNHIFKNRSLTDLISFLKRPPKKKIPFFMEDIQISNPKEEKNTDYNAYSPPPLLKKIEEEMKQSQLRKMKRIKIITKDSERTHVIPGMDNPFKYNPNYQSIYKNIPSFRFSTLPFKLFNSAEKKRTFSSLAKSSSVDKINGLEGTGTPKKSKDNTLNNSRSSNHKKFFTDLNSPNEKTLKKNKTNLASIIDPHKINFSRNVNTLLPNISKNDSVINKSTLNKSSTSISNQNEETSRKNDKDNHIRRFSKYYSRKDHFILKNQSKILSYIEPIDYSKTKVKCVNFGKLTRRKDVFINLHSNEVPPTCFYSPKYGLLEDRTRNVVFDTHMYKNDNHGRKRYLLEKLWRSYDAQIDYKLINGEKLPTLKKNSFNVMNNENKEEKKE